MCRFGLSIGTERNGERITNWTCELESWIRKILEMIR